MPLLFQSILLVGITCYLLSTLLFALTRDMPRLQRGVGWWALSAFAGALGYCALLYYGSTGNPAQGEALYNISLISWSSFLLIGSSHWLRKSIPPSLILLITSLSTAWVIYFNFIQPIFLPAAIVTALTCGTLTLTTAWLFLKSKKTKDIQSRLLIGTLFISGIHALDYPILRPHESFAMVGIIFCIIASLSINIILASLVITQFRKRMERSEKEAINMAMQDPLTGLKNRMGLAEEFEKVVGSTNTKKHKVALIYADLDDFKEINDTYGHEDGDQVLRITAARLKAMVRHNDVTARVGGDEFIILLTDIELHDWEHIPQFISRMINKVCETIKVNQDKHQVGVSIGLAVYPKNGETLQSLINYADNSMYLDKKMKKMAKKQSRHTNLTVHSEHSASLIEN